MDKRVKSCWGNSRNKEILLSFANPKTPRQVEKELNIKRFNMRLLLERNLIMCLTPELHRCRLYTLTDNARNILDMPRPKTDLEPKWNLIGWIKVSPKERLIVLSVMNKTTRKLTSEEIRRKTKPMNPCHSRSSVKDILRDLGNKNLVESEIKNRRKYYWLSAKGRSISMDLNSLEI